MNIADLTEMTTASMQIEAMRAALEIDLQVEEAVQSAAENLSEEVIEDVAEISEYAQKLFSLSV